MLFHSSLRRELGRSFSASLLVLLTVVITMLLIRTLGLAQRGSVNPEEIFMVLSYTVIGRLPMVLTLALFIAVVSTLSRMYRDSEMVIWFTSGRGIASFLGPIFRFAWPILVVIALLALFAWPWASAQTDALRDRFERRGDIERVTPGQFQESAGGQRVFFIEKNTTNGTEGRNIFISSTDRQGQESILSARSGRVQSDGEQRLLLLEQGQHLELGLPEPDGGIRVSEFALYGIRLVNDATPAPGATPTALSVSLKARPTHDLIAQPTAFNLGELSWRLGVGLAALNLTLLGVALAAGNPRVGKSGHLLLVLFAFVVYTNLLNISQSWIASGLVNWVPMMLGLHGGVFALSGLWLAQRHYGWTLPIMRPHLRGSAT
jgi:lipopolysaccharide export system permease protein